MRAANVVNATGVWADRLRPDELHDEAEVPRIRPEPRHAHHAAPRRRCRSIGGAIVPAGGGRSIFALPWLGAHADRHDRQRLRHRRPRPHPARRRATSTTCSTRRTRSSAPTLTLGDLDGRLRGRAAADLHRRPEEVGRHLAQGRALRDLQRDDHDHRRQAHDVAADGEDDRRPRSSSARRATRPAARTRSRSARRSSPDDAARASRACPRTPTPRSPAATATAAHDVLAVAAERGELAQPIVDGRPARPARRGRPRRPPRAGPVGRRRAAAPHAPGPAGRPGA